VRRAETQTRVIGTLLGHVNPDGSVEVKNAYAVPHNEQNGQVFVDVEFHRAMADLAKKVNPAEVVVGWYSTGNGVVPTDALIHEFYNHECKNPVHVTLDTQFTDGQKLMRAWVGRSVAIGAAAIEGKGLSHPTRSASLNAHTRLTPSFSSYQARKLRRRRRWRRRRRRRTIPTLKKSKKVLDLTRKPRNAGSR
jgi:hypothetical protein